MTEAAKKLHSEYVKKWKAEHPDRVKIHRERYWEKKAAALAEKMIAEREAAQKEQQ